MWPSIIAAGANILGGLLSSKGQKDANEDNIELSRENREWQERMSNTSHQREVADLQAAGLNPILSASRGAPMPSSAAAVSHNEMAGLAGGVSNSASDYYKNRREREEIKKLQQEWEIKNPVAKGAKYIGAGVDAIKPAVEAAVSAVLDFKTNAGLKLGEVREGAAKLAEGVSGSTAAAVETVKDAAKKFGVTLDEVLEAPSKFVSGVTTSASDAVQRGRAAVASESGSLKNTIRAGSFTGNKVVDQKDIMSIKDPVERRKARQSYNLWLHRNNRR